MSGKNKTILLVEDEVILAMTEKMVLEKYGYNAIIVNSGEKAVEIVNNTPGIQLILMDIDLGKGIDGTEAAEIILKDHDIPVIFCSSHTEPEIVEKTEKITSYGYVVKSSSNTVLDASIKMAFKLFEANRKIGDSELIQKAMISNISDVIGIIGVDGIMKYKSPNIEKWFGWKPKDLIGTDGWLTVHPDDLKRIQKEFFILLENDTSSTMVEYRYKCKDGSYKPVELTATNLINNPLINGVLLNYHDISARKQAEKALHESEKQLLLITNNTLESIWAMDSDFRFSYLSPYTESLFGYTLKEWETLDWNVFISPDYKEFVFNYLNNLKLKNEVVLPIIPVSVRHKNGNEMWVEFSANGIFDKDNVFTGIAGITRDVTARKLAEKKLEKKNAYIKMILDNFPIGIATNEIDSMKVTYMNRKFSEFYGWAEDDFPDVGIFFEKVFPELEYRQQMQTRILADLASGDIERMNWDDLKITTKTGDQRIVHAFNIPLLDQNIMVSTVQDITERKQAEEKNKSLLAEKELILKEVNHRIKNNMNTMKGLLLLQATTMNEAAAKTALENASKRMQSMEILYDQLYQSAAFTELSIKSYLSPLIDAFIVSFPEGNLVKVEKHIDDFILDAKRLQPLGIIINELLTNIMKYAFTNKSKGIITVTVILEDAHVILSVQDNGKGIPASINFTNSTGFGLMLVHVLTGQLDGKIQIERVGGTRIVLDFEK